MEGRSISPIQRQDFTESMEHSGLSNNNPQPTDNAAFCDGCGFWKHDIVVQDGKGYCSPCTE